MTKERRRFERRDVSFHARIETPDGATVDPKVQVTDISMGGFKIQTAKKLLPYTPYVAWLKHRSQIHHFQFVVLHVMEASYGCEIRSEGAELDDSIVKNDDLVLLALGAGGKSQSVHPNLR